MVIGDPVEHSLSPQMHNAGYAALGIDDQYVYVACHVDVKKIDDFIIGVRAMRIHGISCTIPHKIAVMPLLDEVESIAKKIGAVNTIVNEKGKLIGYNTDWLGVLNPLEQRTTLKGKTVALIGAGGAARAAAFAVVSKDAKLTVYNRTAEKAEKLAKEFTGEAFSLSEIENVKSADIIINTTPIGLDETNETLIPQKYITDKHVIFDAVYGISETQLIKDAKKQGAQIIPGIEMLFHQGFAQFILFTGYEAPAEKMVASLRGV